MMFRRVWLIWILLATSLAAVAETFEVNSDDDTDDGVCNATHCSLREAINAANQTDDTDTIRFHLSGELPYTIALQSTLPRIEKSVVIDGTTQAGYVATPVILIDGNDLFPGFTLNAVSEIRGLALGGMTTAVTITEPNRGKNIVRDCYIGITFDGQTTRPNNRGVAVSSRREGSDKTQVISNVISGNGTGVWVSGGDIFGGATVEVLGNFLGTDATGTIAVGNGTAIYIGFNASADVGDNTPAGRNIISGNQSAISMSSSEDLWPGLDCNDNYIGTDVTGRLPLGNRNSGISVASYGSAYISNCIIADNSSGVSGSWCWISVSGSYIGTNEHGDKLGNRYSGVSISVPYGAGVSGNVIAYNGSHGVNLYDWVSVSHNTIHSNGGNGINNRGSLYDDAYFTMNSIYNNSGLGIDLNGDGVTPNDKDDADRGANDLLNFPILRGVVPDGAQIVLSGTYQGLANQTLILDFYANSACDPSRHGEGEEYVGSVTITTDDLGEAAFSESFPGTFTDGTSFTGLAKIENRMTSEFSPCLTYPTLFEDDFESGDLAAWQTPSLRRSSMSVVENDTNGAYALRLDLAQGGSAYLTDDSAEAAQDFSVRFWADFSNVALASGDQLILFSSWDATADDRIQLVVSESNGTKYITVRVRLDDDQWRESAAPLPDQWHEIEIGFHAGDGDGGLTLYLNQEEHARIEGLTNSATYLDGLHWGQIGTLSAETQGYVLLDYYTSATGRRIGSRFCLSLLVELPRWDDELTVLDLITNLCP